MSQQYINVPVPKLSKNDIRFLFLMYDLQTRYDLTYREARVILKELRGESNKDLAEEFGCTPQAISCFKGNAERKMSVPDELIS